jgi:hypothetical protein
MTNNYRLLFVVLLFSSSLLSAQTSLTLISKNKKYKIKFDEECNINTIPFSNDTVKNYYQIHIGYIINFKDSILTIKDYGLNTVQQKTDGTQQLDRVGLDNVTYNINIRQIEEIENFRKWFMAPTAIGWLSLISSVVVSPLVSTNFKTGTFNTDKFLKISGVSLGTSAISFSIAYGFGRHSSFINNGRKDHKRLWIIQP